MLRPSGRATAGGVLRDFAGRILQTYTLNLGKCSITRAELRGAVEDMCIAWDMGIRKLEIQLDSAAAIQILTAQIPRITNAWRWLLNSATYMHEIGRLGSACLPRSECSCGLYCRPRPYSTSWQPRNWHSR
ncbi:Putative ribonuclease H protein At1g65750 [Linum grandiflorum]